MPPEPMHIYKLWVKIDGRWEWLCDIKAETHRKAFQDAMLCLESKHYDKPIRLEKIQTESD